MIHTLKHLILRTLAPLERRGITFTMPRKNVPPEVCRQIYECRPMSFCPWTHFAAAWRALEYINENGILGDVVLCGVARGGLAKFMQMHLRKRKLWLYDMFDGGSLPGAKDGDFERQHGEKIKRIMAVDRQKVLDYLMYKQGNTAFVSGNILETIPEHMPRSVSLLYLDTDYYDTTLHELKWLEPKVEHGGVIIQDDMGLCIGARRAVDEYYADRVKPMIVPIDEAGCVWQKL